MPKNLLLVVICTILPASLFAQKNDQTLFGTRIGGNGTDEIFASTTIEIEDPVSNTQWQSVWKNASGLRSIYFFTPDETYTESGANTQSGNWQLSPPTSTAALATLVLTPTSAGAARTFDISVDGKFLTQDNGLRWEKLGENTGEKTPASSGKFDFAGTKWVAAPTSPVNTEIEFRAGQLALIVTNTMTANGAIPTSKEFVAWKELSDGLVEISHANGMQAVHILNADKTLSKTGSAEQWTLAKSAVANDTDTTTSPVAKNDTDAKTIEEEKEISPHIKKLNELLDQYKTAMTDAARLQNNRDTSLLESLNRRATQAGDIELAMRVQDALTAVKESAPFNFVTEYDTPEKVRKAKSAAATDRAIRDEIELIEIKEKRDKAILELSKTINARFKAPFDTLLRDAMSENDLAAAKAIKAEQDARVNNFNDMQKSVFVGKRWSWLEDGTSQGFVTFLGNGSLSAPPALNLARWQTTIPPDGTIRVYRKNGTYFVFKPNEGGSFANTLDALGTVVDTVKTVRSLQVSNPAPGGGKRPAR